MLNRRLFLGALMGAALTGGMAHAQDYAGDIITRLRGQGFTIVSSRRTLLGRVSIIAESSRGRREIIVNPRTGEILRDLWIAKGSGSTRPAILDGDNSGHGGGGGGDDGEDDEDDDDSGDDDEDDEDDEDNSGSGSGHSGGDDDSDDD
jgi:hypothetical protein